MRLQCGHAVLCRACLYLISKNDNLCPLCRRDIGSPFHTPIHTHTERPASARRDGVEPVVFFLNENTRSVVSLSLSATSTRQKFTSCAVTRRCCEATVIASQTDYMDTYVPSGGRRSEARVSGRFLTEFEFERARERGRWSRADDGRWLRDSCEGSFSTFLKKNHFRGACVLRVFSVGRDARARARVCEEEKKETRSSFGCWRLKLRVLWFFLQV